MSERIYPLLRQLLSTNEPIEENKRRWNSFYERFSDLIEERFNVRRGAVQKLLQRNYSESLV